MEETIVMDAYTKFKLETKWILEGIAERLANSTGNEYEIGRTLGPGLNLESQPFYWGLKRVEKERNPWLLGLRNKRSLLAEVMVSGHANHPHPIRAFSYERELDTVLKETFGKLSDLEEYGGVHLTTFTRQLQP